MPPGDEFRSESAYGAVQPFGGPGGRRQMDGLKVIEGGGRQAAPATPSGTDLTGLLDDPTFWFVATLGAILALARYSVLR